MRRKINVINANTGKTVSVEYEERNSFHFEGQRKYPHHVVPAKKGKGAVYSRKQKHKKGYMDNED